MALRYSISFTAQETLTVFGKWNDVLGLAAHNIVVNRADDECGLKVQGHGINNDAPDKVMPVIRQAA
jgi:hypothetical protein